MRVLVVDDNETFRMQTARYLGLHDIEVDTAACGEDALRMLREHGYDSVLLDLKMPDMQGLDVLRQAKADGIRSPVIVVTGYGDVASAVEAMKAGAVDFIEKPFEPERLLSLVKETALSHQGLPSAETWVQSLLAGRDSNAAVLLIGEQPDRLEQMLSIEAEEHLPLTSDVSLADLRTAITAFIERHGTGFIVHAGIRSLFACNDADMVKRYLGHLHRCAESGGVTLLVLYDTSMEQQVMDSVVDDTDMALFVEDVIATLNHSIRRNILHLLEQHDLLPYSFFLKNMDIDYSAKLAFHLNRLQDNDLVTKTGEGYRLTERGHSFATLYRSLLLQQHGEEHNVLYHPFTGADDEASGVTPQ
ncbi:MAG: response regulator [Thermoplasmatota archaeon]